MFDFIFVIILIKKHFFIKMGHTISKTFSPRKTSRRRTSYYARGHYETSSFRDSHFRKKYPFRDDIVKVKIYRNGRVT